MGDFYGTGIEIWAGFGPVGNTEKKLGSIMSNFLGWFLKVSYTFYTSKCATIYGNIFGVYDGFIDQKILKL